MEACAPSPEADKALDVASFTANLFGTDEILALWSKAISAENFAILLVQHVFEPSELNGCNVLELGNRKPLNGGCPSVFPDTTIIWTWATSAWLTKSHWHLSPVTQTWSSQCLDKCVLLFYLNSFNLNKYFVKHSVLVFVCFNLFWLKNKKSKSKQLSGGKV